MRLKLSKTGIMVNYDEMFDDKKARHVKSFIKDNVQKMRERFPDIQEDIEERLEKRWEARREKVRGRWRLRLPKLRRKKEKTENEE